MKHLRTLAPGVMLAVAAAATAFALARYRQGLSPLTVALVLGLLLGNAGRTPAICQPGLRFSTRHLLRWGVVLLGLQLSVRDVFRLGGWGLLAVVGVVGITFLGTQGLARALGVGPGVGLLTATGYSICGVSAVTAMVGAIDGDERDATYAIGLVTLFGGVSIFALPALGHLVDAGAVRFGMWAGSSVHDVAQVVATASTYSPSALAPAVVVKLTRVVMLAPLVAAMVLRRRRTSSVSGASRPPLVPKFVALFLLAVALRSADIVGPGMLNGAKTLEKFTLATALVGLGTGVRLKDMRSLGVRPLVLGLTSWILVMTVSAIAIGLLPPSAV